MSDTFAVRVHLFARYAELLGRSTMDVTVPRGATVADTVALLRSCPGGDALPEKPLVARETDQVPGHTPVHPGDELALLPPMSGG